VQVNDKFSRWQGPALAVAGYALLALVEIAVAAMSWTGLMGFAEDTLRLSGLQALAVPVSLDGAAAALAFLTLRSVIRAESATGRRVMVLAFTLASAYINWHHGITAYADGAAPLFFAGMSVAVLAVFDSVVREVRRTALGVIGAVEAPTPRFRALRWARFPRETWDAWSLALRYGYRTPAEALSKLRHTDAERDEIDKVDRADAEALDGLSKKDLARAALTACDMNVKTALAWLDERGHKVDRSYAYEQRTAMQAEEQRRAVQRRAEFAAV
jgi:hypothetical protein